MPPNAGGKLPAGKTAVLQFSVFSTRTTREFAAAAWTNGVHLLGTAHAKCAFVAADIGLAIRGQRASTLFAFFFHFQRHPITRL